MLSLNWLNCAHCKYNSWKLIILYYHCYTRGHNKLIHFEFLVLHRFRCYILIVCFSIKFFHHLDIEFNEIQLGNFRFKLHCNVYNHSDWNDNKIHWPNFNICLISNYSLRVRKCNCIDNHTQLTCWLNILFGCGIKLINYISIHNGL
jgi:hypothetical protein